MTLFRPINTNIIDSKLTYEWKTFSTKWSVINFVLVDIFGMAVTQPVPGKQYLLATIDKKGILQYDEKGFLLSSKKPLTKAVYLEVDKNKTLSFNDVRTRSYLKSQMKSILEFIDVDITNTHLSFAPLLPISQGSQLYSYNQLSPNNNDIIVNVNNKSKADLSTDGYAKPQHFNENNIYLILTMILIIFFILAFIIIIGINTRKNLRKINKNCKNTCQIPHTTHVKPVIQLS